jgi:hypothetical protein
MEYRTRGLMLARLVGAQWWWLRRMLAFVAANEGPRGNVPNKTDEVGAARAGPAGHQNPPVRKGQRR